MFLLLYEGGIDASLAEPASVSGATAFSSVPPAHATLPQTHRQRYFQLYCSMF
jgi:hypothetical protein